MSDAHEVGPPRDPQKARLLRIYTALAERFGPQRWWPGRPAFEVAVGAILMQHTAWTNAARAIQALRAAGVLEPWRLAALGTPALESLIRPARTYVTKARRLRAFVEFLLERHSGRFGGLRRAPLGPLRSSLLAVPGLGPETVDSILLHAAGRPVFVAEAHAWRVFARHRLVSPAARYEELRAFAESHLPSDPRLFNEFHALLVAVGKRYCRAVPLCGECPLRPDLGGRPPRSI